MTEQPLRECPNPECATHQGEVCGPRVDRCLSISGPKRTVTCHCGMEGPKADTEAEAARLWNAIPSAAEAQDLRRKLYDAHADLGADGGITESECFCEDCTTYRETHNE